MNSQSNSVMVQPLLAVLRNLFIKPFPPSLLNEQIEATNQY